METHTPNQTSYPENPVLNGKLVVKKMLKKKDCPVAKLKLIVKVKCLYANVHQLNILPICAV